jgi:hypothetical protein
VEACRRPKKKETKVYNHDDDVKREGFGGTRACTSNSTDSKPALENLAIKSTSLNLKNQLVGSTSPVEPQKTFRRVEAGDARFDENGLMVRLWELAAKPSLCRIDKLQSRCLRTSQHQRVIARRKHL